MNQIKRYSYVKCEECRYRGLPTCRKPNARWSRIEIPGCMVPECSAARYRKTSPSGCPVCGSQIDGNSLCRYCAELYGIVRDARAGRDPARTILDRRRKEEESAL